MSNKPLEQMNEVDRTLRKLFPVGQYGFKPNGVSVTIELIHGFELFNTRPYHNYETWSDGYRITTDNGITVEAEDLDDALVKLQAAMEAVEAGKP